MHKITLCAIDFVQYSCFLAVRIVSLLNGVQKKAVDDLLWFVSYFDLLLFQNATKFLGKIGNKKNRKIFSEKIDRILK